jgi:hypothetical protein
LAGRRAAGARARLRPRGRRRSARRTTPSRRAPNSLDQEVGLALGAQTGEARLSEVVHDAGFSRFRHAADTPFDLVLEARP